MKKDMNKTYMCHIHTSREPGKCQWLTLKDGEPALTTRAELAEELPYETINAHIFALCLQNGFQVQADYVPLSSIDVETPVKIKALFANSR